jgi:putative tricarboxylic transport membrane protein
MKIGERLSLMMWLAVAAAICFGSVKLSLGALQKPGPGFFPFLAGSVLGLFSLLSLLQSFKRPPEDEKEQVWPKAQRALKIAAVVLALILYAIGMNYLGFTLSTLLFLGFLLRGIDPQRWVVVLAVSILGTTLSYGVFQFWLGAQLPKGPWGF